MLSEPANKGNKESAGIDMPQTEPPAAGVFDPVEQGQDIERALLKVVDAEYKKQEEIAAEGIKALQTFNPVLKDFMKQEKIFWDQQADLNAGDKELLISHFISLSDNLKHVEESLALVESALGRNICLIVRYVIISMQLFASEVLKIVNKDQIDAKKLNLSLTKFNTFRIEKFGEFASVVNLLSTDIFTQESLKGHFESGVIHELFNALKVPAIPESLLVEYKTQKDNTGKLDFSDFNKRYEQAKMLPPEEDEYSLRWKMFELLLPSAGEKRLSLDFLSQIYDVLKRYKKEKGTN